MTSHILGSTLQLGHMVARMPLAGGGSSFSERLSLDADQLISWTQAQMENDVRFGGFWLDEQARGELHGQIITCGLALNRYALLSGLGESLKSSLSEASNPSTTIKSDIAALCDVKRMEGWEEAGHEKHPLLLYLSTVGSLRGPQKFEVSVPKTPYGPQTSEKVEVRSAASGRSAGSRQEPAPAHRAPAARFASPAPTPRGAVVTPPEEIVGPPPALIQEARTQYQPFAKALFGEHVGWDREGLIYTSIARSMQYPFEGNIRLSDGLLRPIRLPESLKDIGGEIRDGFMNDKDIDLIFAAIPHSPSKGAYETLRTELLEAARNAGHYDRTPHIHMAGKDHKLAPDNRAVVIYSDSDEVWSVERYFGNWYLHLKPTQGEETWAIATFLSPRIHLPNGNQLAVAYNPQNYTLFIDDPKAKSGLYGVEAEIRHVIEEYERGRKQNTYAMMDLVRRAIGWGYNESVREALFQGASPGIQGSIPTASSPDAQLLIDISRLINDQYLPPDPFVIYMKNVAKLAQEKP